MAVERTLTILKPDAIAKNAAGQIIARFEKTGLKVLAAMLIHLSPAQAAGFYIVHKERPFYSSLCAFMTQRQWLPMVLEAAEGIALGFGAPLVLSIAMVATSGDPSLLILPLPFLCALWLIQGLAPAGYTLEADGVRIERRWLSRLIPYRFIHGVDREPRAVGGLGAVGLNGLFGSQGPRWNRRTGWHYLAITNTTDLV